MRGKCITCKKIVSRQEKRKFLDKPYIPEEFNTDSANVYRFVCKSTRDCGIFDIVTFYDKSHPTKQQKRHVGDLALWNLAQDHKPNKQKYQSTIGAYTRLIKKDTEDVYLRILSASRRFALLYPSGAWALMAARNRLRISME